MAWGDFFLCRGGDMGVGVQGEACGEVTQYAGYGLDVHTVLQGYGCKGVSEIAEPNLWNTCSCQYSFQHIIDTVR